MRMFAASYRRLHLFSALIQESALFAPWTFPKAYHMVSNGNVSNVSLFRPLIERIRSVPVESY